MNRVGLALISIFAILISGGVWADDCKRMFREGETRYLKGEFAQAAETFEAISTCPEVKNDPDAYLDVLMHLSGAYQSMGFHQKALTTLSKGIPVAEETPNRVRRILFFNTLAEVWLSAGEPDRAFAYLKRILPEADRMDHPIVLATVLNTLGNLHATDKFYREASAAYQESLEKLDKTDGGKAAFSVLKTDVRTNLAWAAFLGKNYRKAGDAVKAVLRDIDRLPLSPGTVRDLIDLHVLVVRGAGIPEFAAEKIGPEIAVCFRLLEKAKKIAEAIHDNRLLSLSHGYMARLYESEHRYSEAMRLTQKAMFYSRQGNHPECVYLWQWQTGRLHKAGGDFENAIDAYQRAIDTLMPIHMELFGEYRSRHDMFHENIRPVYVELAELYLDEADTVQSDVKREDLLLKAVGVMDRMKAAELQSFYMDECVAETRKDTVLGNTPRRAALLYPIMMKDRLSLLLLTHKTIRHVAVPADFRTVTKAAASFRIGLQNRTRYVFRKNGKKLYDWLIRPLEEELAAIDTLIVAPDGALRLIPFAALFDGKKFLVEKFAIGTIPAISLIDPYPVDHSHTRVLAAGITAGVQNFSPLPSVAGELSEISRTMGTSAVLLDANYTIENMAVELESKPYNVLHLATHGVFGGSPENTFLLTYDGRMTMDRLRDLINLGIYRENRIELLSLSACQTALGDERSALGLAGVAIKTGVGSALATLWYVDDEATSMAVREFYRQLRMPETTKAKALRNAQTMLISQRKYWHPVYWAPFVLIGNWF